MNTGSFSARRATSASDDSDGQVQADCESVRELIAGLDRLEVEMSGLRESAPARRLGYFTPDHSDRVKGLLLAYRNQRLALFEIIYRYRDYRDASDRERQLRGFMVGFAAGLSLYAKSLALIRAFERDPLVRAKLNEPEPKMGLEAGFFDQVLRGYSSIGNYRTLVEGARFWQRHRREAGQLGLAKSPGWDWLPDFIRREHRVVRRRLADVLVRRLRYDWRLFWQTALRPLRGARYSVRAFLGTSFAEYRIDPDHRPRLDTAVFDSLGPRLRPGDVLLMRAEGKLTSAVLPGFWAHAAMFLGQGSDLQNSKPVRGGPASAASKAAIRDDDSPHGWVIESISPRVRLAPLALSLRADHVCVLRAELPPDEINAAITEALSHLDKPYDFEFDFNQTLRIVCTGLIYRSYHRRGAIAFDLVKRLGRWTLSGDDIMNQILRPSVDEDAGGSGRFRPVALVLTRRNLQPWFCPDGAIPRTLRRIQRGWRPIRIGRKKSHGPEE